MNGIFAHTPPGRVVNFSRFLGPVPEAEYLLAVVQILEGLRELVEPLMVEIELAVWEDDDLGLKGGDVPPSFRWARTRRQDMHREIAVRDWATYGRDDRVGSLGPERLGVWLNERVAEASATVEGRVGIATLEFSATAARCPRPMDADHLEVMWGAVMLHVPLLHREGATWALGPVEPAPLCPGVGVRLMRDAGCIMLAVSLGWSLWTESEPAGPAQVRRVFDRIGALGWT